jgi:hypothetical protein
VPSANTLVRRVNENAFAFIVQARPVPPLADQFIFGVAPIDYSPVAESARGIAPRAAHRTGRKPLDLSGSCHRLKAAAFRPDLSVPPVSG